MPRKSYKELNEALTVCRKRCLDLSTDPYYGITTWRAKDYVLHDMGEQGYVIRFLVLVQINDFQKYQAMYGQPGFNRKIRILCKINNPNIVMRVRCSEDEILFFVSETSSAGTSVYAIDSIRTTLKATGLNANIAHKEFNYGAIDDELRTLQAVAQARKEGYQL